MIIRHATPDDVAALTALEADCFPPAEAASAQAIRERVAAYPDRFWLLFEQQDSPVEPSGDDAPDDRGEDAKHGRRLVAAVNGFTTNLPDLTDDMYDDATMHDPDGVWQMIFGVDTASDRRHRGYASLLLRRVIDDVRREGRSGLVLTCKQGLIGFYARFGFVDEGVSGSTHGGVVWHQMRLTF